MKNMEIIVTLVLIIIILILTFNLKMMRNEVDDMWSMWETQLFIDKSQNATDIKIVESLYRITR